MLGAFIDGRPVSVLSVEENEATLPMWQQPASDKRPSVLVSGVTDGRLHLWPTPTEPGEIRLRVQRLPMNRMCSGADRPEIRAELHQALVSWMLYRAYSRQDTDLYDERKAAMNLAKFESEFGRKTSGRNEEWVRRGVGLMPAPIA